MEKERKHGNLRRWYVSACCLAAVLVCVIVLPSVCVLAADGETNGDRTLSLAVELSYDGEAIEGVEVCLFYVGSFSDDELVFEGDFANYEITIEEDGDETDWDAVALTLTGYSYLDALEPDEKDFTDANGEAYFPTNGETLQQGVYLVLTQAFEQDGVTCSTQPFLVMLPDVDDSDHITYQVVATPKVSGRIGMQRFTVLKIWDDSDSETRPDSVDVTLVSDEGEVWGTVTLSEENSWRYTFTGLSGDCSWYIVEDVPDGYTVLQTVDGSTVALMNTEEEEEPNTTPAADNTTTTDTTTETDGGTTTAPDGDTTTAPDGDTTTASDGDTTTAPDGDTTTASDGDTTTAAEDSTKTADGQEDTTKAASSSSDGEGTTTTLTKLPQTGTLWWVVPILACCGMVSVLIGVAKKRGQEEKE